MLREYFSLRLSRSFFGLGEVWSTSTTQPSVLSGSPQFLIISHSRFASAISGTEGLPFLSLAPPHRQLRLFPPLAKFSSAPSGFFRLASALLSPFGSFRRSSEELSLPLCYT